MKAQSEPSVSVKLDTGTHTSEIKQILVTVSGRLIITAGECTIRVWDALTRRPLHMILGHYWGHSEEFLDSGHVIRMALCPKDDRSLVVLKYMSPPPGRRAGRHRPVEVQVFDIETGNLRARYVHPGAACDLDFSPDGRFLAVVEQRATLEVFETTDVLKAGFDRLPQPVVSERLEPRAPASFARASVRFIPVHRKRSDPYRLLVASNCGGRDPQLQVPVGLQIPGLGQGRLHWATFKGAQGLRVVRSHRPGPDIDTQTLAVNDEWAVIAVATHDGTDPALWGRVLCFAHDESLQAVLPLERPAATLAFSPTGSRLLVGLQDRVRIDPGRRVLPVHAYAVSCLGFELRSTYYGHDDSITAAAFLADELALSAGGDNQTIHFWSASSQVGQMQAVIRGVGSTTFNAHIDKAQQVVFESVPERLLLPDNTGSRRQRTFCLHSLRLGATDPLRVGQRMARGGKWVVLHSTFNRWLTVPIWHRASISGEDPDQAPDLTLFVGNDDEWVLWTRSGYYDASPLGARRMGYHVSRGPHQEALFMPSDRFKDFHKPDIVRAVIDFGTEELARTRGGMRIDVPVVAAMLPPVIELQRTRHEVESDEVSFGFSVQTLGSAPPVQRVWVLRNNRFAWTASSIHARDGRYRTPKLALGPGRNVFSIRAENATGRAEPIELEVMGPKAAPQSALAFEASGNLYLLSVGVSNFQAAGTPAALKREYFPLKCAHRDAIAVYNALACSVESASVVPNRPLRNRAFDAVHAHLLVDGQATKQAIMSALKSLCTQIKQRGEAPGAERDVLVIFLAGHGVPQVDDPELYFLNHDAVFDELEATGVAIMELGEVIATVPAEVVILLDTCHSGMAGNGVDRGVGPDAVARRLQQVSERGMYVLSAARAQELAREGGEGGHGVFTEALLATLKSARYMRKDSSGKTSSLTMASLMAGLQAETPRVTARLGKLPQTPVFRLFGDLLTLTIYRR